MLFLRDAARSAPAKPWARGRQALLTRLPDSLHSTKAKRGEIQPYLKTKSGERQVESVLLSGENASGLRRQADGRIAFPFFDRCPTPAIEHPERQFASCPRGTQACEGRLQHLSSLPHHSPSKDRMSEVLRHFWSGHAPKHVSERYTKLREEPDFRLEWAEKVGLVLSCPNWAKKASFGQLVQFSESNVKSVVDC